MKESNFPGIQLKHENPRNSSRHPVALLKSTSHITVHIAAVFHVTYSWVTYITIPFSHTKLNHILSIKYNITSICYTYDTVIVTVEALRLSARVGGVLSSYCNGDCHSKRTWYTQEVEVWWQSSVELEEQAGYVTNKLVPEHKPGR
jgi:hypothetical protein